MGEVYNDLPCTIEDVVGLIGIQVIRNTNTLMMEPGTGRTLKIPGIRALIIWLKYPGISPK